jgi:glutathione peroxidase
MARPLFSSFLSAPSGDRAVWFWRGLGLLGMALLAVAPQAWTAPSACPGLLNHSFPRLQDDAPQNLCQYQGKVLIIVNTASFCGFTPQYEGLEKLYSRYKEKGLVVLGFPSNDFGNQEPGSNQKIAEFCTNTFGVKFPMFAKSSVRGGQSNALFRSLAQMSEAPGWNFHKYILDRQGRLVRSYSSQVQPDDRRLIADIERALAAQPS